MKKIKIALMCIVVLLGFVFVSCGDAHIPDKDGTDLTDYHLDSEYDTTAEYDSKEVVDPVKVFPSFEDEIYIKCGDVSNQPSHQSIFSFLPDNVVQYSRNMYEGFMEGENNYFVEYENIEDSSVKYEIWFYDKRQNPDNKMLMFTVYDDGSVKDELNSPTSLITKEEYDEIFLSHVEINTEIYNRWLSFVQE